MTLPISGLIGWSIVNRDVYNMVKRPNVLLQQHHPHRPSLHHHQQSYFSQPVTMRSSSLILATAYSTLVSSCFEPELRLTFHPQNNGHGVAHTVAMDDDHKSTDFPGIGTQSSFKYNWNTLSSKDVDLSRAIPEDEVDNFAYELVANHGWGSNEGRSDSGPEAFEMTVTAGQ